MRHKNKVPKSLDIVIRNPNGSTETVNVYNGEQVILTLPFVAEDNDYLEMSGTIYLKVNFLWSAP